MFDTVEIGEATGKETGMVKAVSLEDSLLRIPKNLRNQPYGCIAGQINWSLNYWFSTWVPQDAYATGWHTILERLGVQIYTQDSQDKPKDFL